MQQIKDLLVHKNVVPIYIQNKLMKELDFQIKGFENKNKISQSPKKSRNCRVKTLDQSSQYVKLERSVRKSYNKDQNCLRCQKFNFQNKIIIQCITGQHIYVS
ncbi:unnamed protein product [Paramecium sonneborni]|uniref:Uncharacterized protein n=1 Tax=Paramecium sonneborni TaxID=65129 RepID=A0A8S1MD49_9CILI|nr:unnamed protein product [Paramecium sonneborni]